MIISINPREVNVKLSDNESVDCLSDILSTLSKHIPNALRDTSTGEAESTPHNQVTVAGMTQLDLIILTLLDSRLPLRAKEISERILSYPGYKSTSKNHVATIGARLCVSKEYFEAHEGKWTLSILGRIHAQKITRGTCVLDIIN